MAQRDWFSANRAYVFGEERVLEMRRLILAESEKEATYALEQLLHFQQEDFYQMLKVVQDKPMVVRLLDPPMHEFYLMKRMIFNYWRSNYNGSR